MVKVLDVDLYVFPRGEMSNLAIQQSAPVDAIGMLPPGSGDHYALVRALPIFEGITDAELHAAINQRGITVRHVERDMFVPSPGDAPANGAAAPAVLVAAGQIAAAVFVEAELAERRASQVAHERASTEEREEESLIRAAPLARVAVKNVALFMVGDLFNTGALAATRGQPIAFYTAAPSTLIQIDHKWLAELAARHPQFEQRIRRALTIAKERLAWVSGVKQELLDFFVRQGISVSGEMVRVRQLGLCIDCKLCEEACEDRYGAKRLTLGGYHLGMLDFIYTCRTCTDQRCIDPCAYDSIKYDLVKKEVVINESTCTGCTACAQSCPYGAIDMVEVETDSPTFKKGFKKRLDKKDALVFGAGTPRVARARRIANKCDHCIAYGDQACVSACPTGSLIEINAYDLFRERSPAMVQTALTGFDMEPVRKGPREVLPVMPFTEGVDIHTGGLAKVKRGRYAPMAMWIIGLLAFAVTFFEVMLRHYHSPLSYQFYHLRHSADFADLPESAVIEAMGIKAGDHLSTYCGLFGTALMIIAAIYPIFRRFKPFRWLASNTMYFDFHIMAGTIGPMFVALHTVLKLDKWTNTQAISAGLGFWSMIIVVVSGFLGRYLYTQVPSLSGAVELEELDHERAFQVARTQYPIAAAELDAEIAEQRDDASEVALSPSLVRALSWLFAEDLRRLPRTFARRRAMAKLQVPRKIRNDLARRTGRMIVIARRQVVAPKAQLLLHSWKKVHVPFTILLTVVATAHIWLSWSNAAW